MSTRYLTASRLRELVNYDPDTGIFTWKVYRNSQAKVGDVIGSGHTSPSGYRVAMIDRTFYQQHRLAWLYVYGEWPKEQVDHINRVKTDNRICNLRAVYGFENAQNAMTRSHNTSGYKGVHLVRTTGRWRAQLRVNGRRIDLGTYDNPEKASAAYIDGVKKFCTHHPY